MIQFIIDLWNLPIKSRKIKRRIKKVNKIPSMITLDDKLSDSDSSDDSSDEDPFISEHSYFSSPVWRP